MTANQNSQGSGAKGPGSNMTTAHASGTVVLTALALLIGAGILFRKPARKIT